MIALTSATAIAAILAAGMLLLVLALAGAVLFEKRCPVWLGSALTVALSGYAIFWLGFLHPTAGRVFSWFMFAVSAGILVWRRRMAWLQLREQAHFVLILGLAAIVYGSLLELYPTTSWSLGARTRFLDMPGDNEIPRIFADITRSGDPTRILGGDWLTSDRPPLQTGVALLTLPVLTTIGFDLDTSCAVAGLWLQLLWIPAMHALLIRLGVSRQRAYAAVAALAFTGFLFFNSVYVWPKLAAAAFVVAAAAEWFLAPSEDNTGNRARFLRAGACAVCGWLLHGSVMFALAALAPFVLCDWRRWRLWLWSAAVFVAVAAPWLAYQHWYSPPGNRLLKWHIGGDIGPDDLTLSQALRDRYAAVGWKGAWDARRQNARMLLDGGWSGLRTFYAPAQALDRRQNETFFPLRMVACWSLGVLGLPLLAYGAIWKGRRSSTRRFRAHGFAVAWLLLTLLTWVALMFFPNQVFTHQGSYTVQLLLLALLASWAILSHPLLFTAVAVVQVVGFFATWLAPNRSITTPMNTPALVLLLASAAALLVVGARHLFSLETIAARTRVGNATEREAENGGSTQR